MNDKIFADLVSEIGNLAQTIKDNSQAAKAIYTVPMASELTKLEAIATQILAGLASHNNITNSSDKELICRLPVELAETLVNTINTRFQ